MSKNFIFPQKISRRVRLEIERVVGSFREGVHRSAMSGQGMEFQGIRPYDPSDSPAQIDWVASARLSDDDLDLVSRDFNPEREISVVCAVEDTDSMFIPERKQEHAATLSWMFAISAFKYRDSFKFVRFSSDEVRATQWVRQEDSLLGSSFERYSGDLFLYLLGMRIKNVLLVILSDFGPHWQKKYNQLRRLDLRKQNIRCLFIALDEWEGFEPVTHSVTFKDPQSKKTKIFDLRRGGEAEQEALAHRERLAVLKKSIRPLGVSLVSLPLLADDPLGGIRKQLLKLGFE